MEHPRLRPCRFLSHATEHAAAAPRRPGRDAHHQPARPAQRAHVRHVLPAARAAGRGRGAWRRPGAGAARARAAGRSRPGPTSPSSRPRARPPEQAAAYDDAVLAAEEALATFPAPTIAAIHGHCYGGGCALALACDLRFASSGARFAITPAKLGIVYPLRATKRLVDAVGPSRAKFILMSGAGHRRRPGRRDRPRRRGRTTTSTRPCASSPSCSPPAPASPSARSSRPSPASSTAPPHDDDAHAALRDAALASPDYAEGVRAFLERRPPKFG